MQVVPINPVPSQLIKTVLDNQIVNLSIYQLRYGMFMDVTINDTLEIGGVICQNFNRIIRSQYLNANVDFDGDLVWLDTLSQGMDPIYTGLGSQFLLLYLSADELAALGVSG
jgi:hypothetical protein